jgi:CMP-N-acetylneuraminic acid synthetase
MKNLTACIFARGGSKGIPHKNVKIVGGKPLIAHSIECALQSQSIKDVLVSTDDSKIAEVSEKCGAKVLMRPLQLATDESPEILSWRHAIEHLEKSKSEPTFVSLPATSPLRNRGDIDQAIEKFKRNGSDIIFGISPSHRNPYLNMVTVNQEEHIQLVNGGSGAIRRQDTPQVFDITTCVYVSSFEYLKKCKTLMEGKVGYVLIPPWRSLDIDDPFDLHLADLLLKYPYTNSER